MTHGSAVILFVTLNIIVTVVFRSQDVLVYYTSGVASPCSYIGVAKVFQTGAKPERWLMVVCSLA